MANAGPVTATDDASASAGVMPPPRVLLTWRRALWLLVLCVLFLGGRGADFLLIVVGLTLYLATRAVQAASGGVAVGYRLADHHVFLGAPATVVVTVSNGSRWPIPLLLLHLRLPEGVPGAFRRVGSLGPRSVRRFTMRIAGLRRGVYRIGDTRIVFADWFGLRSESADAPVHARFVVYPALLRLPPLRPERRLPVGPRREPGSPFRDDLPVGLRPYRRGDPMRSIAWKATARRGELQVREFPPVRESTAWILLDLDGADWDPLRRHELSEQAVTLAASLLWQRRQEGQAVGFAAWGGLAERSVHGSRAVAPGAWVRFPPRADAGHPLRVLEALAALSLADGGDFAARLRDEAAGMPWGAEVLVLVPRDTPALHAVAETLAARGHPVTLLVCERRMGRPPGLAGARARTVEVHVGDGVSFQ